WAGAANKSGAVLGRLPVKIVAYLLVKRIPIYWKIKDLTGYGVLVRVIYRTLTSVTRVRVPLGPPCLTSRLATVSSLLSLTGHVV
ncbi:MAG: hypothetical protein ACE5JO_03345, partial [Candidatus Binatia bacterium]